MDAPEIDSGLRVWGLGLGFSVQVLGFKGFRSFAAGLWVWMTLPGHSQYLLSRRYSSDCPKGS